MGKGKKLALLMKNIIKAVLCKQTLLQCVHGQYSIVDQITALMFL